MKLREQSLKGHSEDGEFDFLYCCFFVIFVVAVFVGTYIQIIEHIEHGEIENWAY